MCIIWESFLFVKENYKISNEIYHSFDEGETLYALIWRKSDDKVWNNTDSQFDTYTDTDIDKYDVVLANQVDSDYYSVDFPSAITDSTLQSYRVQIMHQVAGSINADNDRAIAQGEIFWDGTSETDIGTINITQSSVVNNYNESVTSPPLQIINL